MIKTPLQFLLVFFLCAVTLTYLAYDRDESQVYHWEENIDSVDLGSPVLPPSVFIVVIEESYIKTPQEILEEIESKKNCNASTLIRKYEGFYENAYYDLDGKVAIGYGFRNSDIPGLKIGDTITREEADIVLEKVVKRYGKIVDSYVNVPIDDGQRAALISFTYNVGEFAFRDSTLLEKINESDYDGASKEFRRWCKVKGKVMNGLLKRRIAERDLFNGIEEDA